MHMHITCWLHAHYLLVACTRASRKRVLRAGALAFRLAEAALRAVCGERDELREERDELVEECDRLAAALRKGRRPRSARQVGRR